MNVLSGANEPETKVVVTVVRVVVVPISGTTVSGVVVPATAAFEAVRARRSAVSPHFFRNYRNI